MQTLKFPAMLCLLVFSVACGDMGRLSSDNLFGNAPLSDLGGELSITPASAYVEAELTATYTGGEAVVFQWKKDEAPIAGATGSTYMATAAGSYAVTVSAAGYNSKTSEAVPVTVHPARGPQPFYVSVQVQTDKTAPALTEILRELRDICGPRPVTPHEFETARNNQALKLSGRWETLDSIADSLCDLITFNRPDDWFQTLPQRYADMTLEQVTAMANTIIKPASLTWIIVGDRTAIEPPIRALNLGTIIIAPPL